MKWHLLGAGAMGSLAAGHLLDAGWQVDALARHQETQLTRRIHWPDGRLQELMLAAPTPARIDHLVLSVKAGQTQQALLPWRERLAPNATLVCLQNGMGQLDGVDLPAGVNVVAAITTNGAFREGSSVRVVAQNSTFLGNGNALPPAWLEELLPHWSGLEWCEDIRRQQLYKLAINALINPLTALHHCRNGELLAPEKSAELVALAAEVDAIITHIEPGWPGHSLERVLQVAAQTAGNVSSMLADVRAGRATEIAYINGWLVTQAYAAGLAAPLNRALVARVGALQAH